MRERLIEILSQPIFPKVGVDPAEVVADYLLDNGVIVPPFAKPKEVSDNGMQRWVCECGNLMYRKQKYCDECGLKFNWED